MFPCHQHDADNENTGRSLSGGLCCCFKCCFNGRYRSLRVEHYCSCAGRAWLLQPNLSLTGGSRAWYRLLLPRWRGRTCYIYPFLRPSGDRPGTGMASAEAGGSNLLKSEFSAQFPEGGSAVSCSPPRYLSQALQQAQVGVDCI